VRDGAGGGINLDEAYLSGVLAQLVDRYRGNIEPVATNLIPVINKVAAGYPTDFTDLSYPRGVADEHLSCPDVADADAFAARVHGESMAPKYREGDLVVFSPAAGTRDGDDCFVRFANGQTTFKRVFTETSGGADLVRLEPRNPHYPVQTVPAEQITGVYKAVYRYQRLNDD
jgi:phage repressor protein C with HTH and peptisase S24 domain